MSRPLQARVFPILSLLVLALAAFAGAPVDAADPDPPATPALHWHAVGEEEVLADREGKPILYFFTADWCAPCHQLKDGLFADPAKASKIAASFVPVEVEDRRVETGSNEPEVDEAIRRYRVRSLPTLVVALPDGREFSQQRGYAGADRAWRWLQQQAAAAGAEIEAPCRADAEGC